MTAAGAGDEQHARLERATADLDAPFAVVDLDAFDRNRADLARRAGGTPIRLASKSVRCRALQRRVLDGPDRAFRGTLALTLPEALWLQDEGFDDLVVAYPTVDRGALRELASRAAAGRPPITVMVDDVAHLDALDAAGASATAPVAVALELDAGLRLAGGRVRVGARRSPLHEPEQLAALAAEIARRPGLRLDGLMAYESQIAGVGDRPPGRRLYGRVVQGMQALSAAELRRRRSRAVQAVQAVAGPLRFVNAGGTGSLESSSSEPAVSEVAAGSGLLAPALFDTYSRFTPSPAAFYALPVVRRPGPGVVTALGGGYVASGAAGPDRLPRPTYPPGLRLDPLEGAGEAQTPLLGAAADALAIGDRVWLRHTKAGELCERFDRLHLVAGDEVVDVVPTYRGDGRTVL
ncbi:amino acid deaminase/aldolase [Patulibacter sp. SYSU D01012]|uniref:amino acid deaminase/aldolase n=1 Tax=Patulibacter sp. SYSU D01012 TaxID=2817381 RepID=UPI001B304C8B